MAVETEAGAAGDGVWTGAEEEPEGTGADISSFLPLTEMVSPVETFLTVRERLDPLEESEDNSPGDLDLVLDQWSPVDLCLLLGRGLLSRLR